MLVLAIESSCDETAAAVVEDGRKVLSSVVASQIEKHKIYGGVVPEIASRCHSEAVVGVTQEALENAGVSLKNIDSIAVTFAPGLIGSLLVGVNFAKGLHLATGIPLVPVHHIRAHIAANYVNFPELAPPFLCLVVSGGHSNIVEVKDYTNMRIIARTRDDAAGEAFDKAARAMEMPYPGGVHLDKIAGKGNPDAFVLPTPKVDGSKYDFSFSGLKTAVVNIIHNANQKGKTLNVEDLSASFRKTAVEYLIEHFMNAARNMNYKKIAICGGVSANSLLRERLKEECKKNGYKLYIPDLELCGDNAAMVGSQGYYEFLAGNMAGLFLNACATRSIEL